MCFEGGGCCGCSWFPRYSLPDVEVLLLYDVGWAEYDVSGCCWVQAESGQARLVEDIGVVVGRKLSHDVLVSGWCAAERR